MALVSLSFCRDFHNTRIDPGNVYEGGQIIDGTDQTTLSDYINQPSSPTNNMVLVNLGHRLDSPRALSTALRLDRCKSLADVVVQNPKKLFCRAKCAGCQNT
jgi:hypothetical protein